MQGNQIEITVKKYSDMISINTGARFETKFNIVRVVANHFLPVMAGLLDKRFIQPFPRFRALEKEINQNIRKGQLFEYEGVVYDYSKKSLDSIVRECFTMEELWDFGYLNRPTIEKRVLYKEMGSCQCGDVRVELEINHSKKTIEVINWEGFKGNVNGCEYIVPYAGGIMLPSNDYTLL